MLLHRVQPDGILELRLNRPQRLNALTLGLARELLGAVHAACADPAVRVLVLRGEGRAFCAGKDRDDPGTAEFVDVLQQLAAALMDCRKPVVAAVQGWAVGAGVELLLNCDIVVAARDARFVLPEVNAGLFGTGGVMALLPRKVGLAKAKGLLLLGQEIDAAQAEAWGLIWEVAADAAALDERVRAIAAQLARADPGILAEVKQLLHRESFDALAPVLAREALAHRRQQQASGPAADADGP
jgi:2-(1,2-epoxy-1,2-dihydrophenyl)acetyl-CoA isomerase